MAYIARRGTPALLLSLCLSSFVFAQGNLLPPAQSGDEAAIHALVERYFAAFQKEDVDAAMGLWGEKSPGRAAVKSTLEKFFALNDRIEVRDLKVRRLVIDGDRASLLVTSASAAVEAKTGRPAVRTGKATRAITLVREPGGWKFWSENSAEEGLATRLAAATSDEERQRLLTDDRELLTMALRVALVKQGSQFGLDGHYSRAHVLLDLAKKVSEQIDDKQGIAIVLRTIGNMHRRRGEYGQALDYLQKGLAVSESIDDKQEIAGVLTYIGIIHEAQGRYTQALDYYQRSLSLNESLGDQRGMSNALNGLGIVNNLQGNQAQAMEHLQKSLKLREAVGDNILIGHSLTNLGIVQQSQGNYAQATEYYRKSLLMKEASGDKRGIANALNSIGVVQQSQGNYAEAMDYYKRSLALRELLGDKPGKSHVLNNIGRVHELQGDYAQAMDFYQRSLALKEALGDRAGIAIVLTNMGIIQELQSNYPQAMEYYEKSVTLSEALGDKEGSARNLINIGSLHRLQGNYARAMDYYQKSLTLAEVLGYKVAMASALNNIGRLHDLEGNYSQAAEYHQKSLTLREALGDKQGIVISLSDLGALNHKQGRPRQALDFAGRAAVLARQIGSLEYLWYSQLIVGRAYTSLGQTDLASQAIGDAIASIELMRTQVAGGEQNVQRFFENKLAPYHSMAHLLLRQEKTGEALSYAERAKARVLLDVMQRGRITVTKAMSPQEREEEQKLRGEMNSLNMRLRREGQSKQPDQVQITDLTSRLQKARLAYEESQNRLYGVHSELRVKRGEAQPLSLEQSAELLVDPETALLEYMVTDEGAFVFVLTGGPRATTSGVTQKPLLRVYDLKVKRKELATLVESLRLRIANNDLDVTALSAKLYDVLVGPAKVQLQGKTRMIVVPDDVLWDVPFQALHPAGGKYLIQTAAISYAPSLTVLREMTRAKSKRLPADTLLAMGNPQLAGQTVARSRSVLMSAPLGPLPDAERLVNSLARIYGPSASRVFTGAEASEDVLKVEAGKHRIVQLATHGVLNDASPMYSHVVLSQSESKNEDGLLEAWEMMNLDLKADLVVLSACETARGRIGAGEGVIGMTWALFVAGSPTTVVSQWKVESSSTTELMLEFHRHLRSKASKSEAMRRAALKLIADRRYAHPFYWAGFIVIGDGN